MCKQQLSDKGRLNTIQNMKIDLENDYSNKIKLETELQEIKKNLAVEKCKLYALGNDRVDQAKEMAKMAVKLFEGEDFDQESLKEGRYYFSEYQKVDGSNIDEYLNAEEAISHSEM